MRTEFRKVRTSAEIGSLVAFDRKVFTASDRFSAEHWRGLHSYWMLINGLKVGCCAFEKHVDFQQDLRKDEMNPPLANSLYIASTGILPRFQGRGFGRLLKGWQIAYAWQNQFNRIVTNTRKRNKPMIHLNRRFNFHVIRITPHYYSQPADSTVVMELRFERR